MCPNNLVNAMSLVLCDPCPALSVTLEGLQSWVIKGATQASGWERVYGYLEPHLKPLGGGRGNLFSCPSRLQLKLRQQSSIGKAHSPHSKNKNV